MLPKDTPVISGADFAWARIFFVYGPGDRDGRLITHMIERFSRGEAAGRAYDTLAVEQGIRSLIR